MDDPLDRARSTLSPSCCTCTPATGSRCGTSSARGRSARMCPVSRGAKSLRAATLISWTNTAGGVAPVAGSGYARATRGTAAGRAATPRLLCPLRDETLHHDHPGQCAAPGPPLPPAATQRHERNVGSEGHDIGRFVTAQRWCRAPRPRQPISGGRVRASATQEFRPKTVISGEGNTPTK